MAKHPHKLLLVDKRTWKCALDGCNFFVHLGLAHVLIGKRAICWTCDAQFIVTESSLQDAKPICGECTAIPMDDDILNIYQANQLKRRQSASNEPDSIEVIEADSDEDSQL